MSKQILLTGVKPTGMPHLGNYIGAIKPALEMAKRDDISSFCFIADYHSLTTIHDPKILAQYTKEVAASWLAMGLNPSTTSIYRQSDVPEIMELNWILSCFTAKGQMNRGHAYKAIVQDNEENSRDNDAGVNIGLYTYPILMASDILIMGADLVPVGRDQLQHIQIARDIANSFNSVYGQTLKEPSGVVDMGNLLVGSDGRKMSKSYNNHIPLFLSEKELKTAIKKIATDTSPPTTPKVPEDSTIFNIYKEFATTDQTQQLKEWYERGIGWGDAKEELFKLLNSTLEEPREVYNEIMNDDSYLQHSLEVGASLARAYAKELLNEVKGRIGIKR